MREPPPDPLDVEMDDVERLIQEFDFAQSVAYLLRRAHFRADMLFDEYMLAEDLTPRQLTLLHAGYQHPGATLVELAELIAMDRNTVAEMLSRMVEKGLLERRPSSTDGRAWSVYPTAAGQERLRQVVPNNDRLTEEIMRPLEPEVRQLFVKCLRVMVGINR